MPGRFFDIQVKPSSVTVSPGGTQPLTYEVTNLVGRPVMASFVIASPEPAKGAWAKVTNGDTRQLMPGVKQDFIISVTPPADAAQGAESQFGVFVKDQGDPEKVFDPGPPFTVKVQGQPAPTEKHKDPPKWIIPVSIAAGVLVVGAVLFFVLRKKTDVLPIVTGLPRAAAAETLKAHHLRDSVVATQFAADRADGTVLRQEPADTTAAKTDSLYTGKKIVRLTIAAPAVQLPDLHNQPLHAALDTLQKLSLLVGDLTPRLTTNAADTQKVLDQQPPAGRVPQGEKVALTVGVFQPPTGPVCRPPFCRVPSKWLVEAQRVNARTMRSLINPGVQRPDSQ